MEHTDQPHVLASLLPQKQPLYELNSRLGGSQNQSQYLREEKNFLPLQETKL